MKRKIRPFEGVVQCGQCCDSPVCECVRNPDEAVEHLLVIWKPAQRCVFYKWLYHLNRLLMAPLNVFPVLSWGFLHHLSVLCGRQWDLKVKRRGPDAGRAGFQIWACAFPSSWATEGITYLPTAKKKKKKKKVQGLVLVMRDATYFAWCLAYSRCSVILFSGWWQHFLWWWQKIVYTKIHRTQRAFVANLFFF